MRLTIIDRIAVGVQEAGRLKQDLADTQCAAQQQEQTLRQRVDKLQQELQDSRDRNAALDIRYPVQT